MRVEIIIVALSFFLVFARPAYSQTEDIDWAVVLRYNKPDLGVDPSVKIEELNGLSIEELFLSFSSLDGYWDFYSERGASNPQLFSLTLGFPRILNDGRVSKLLTVLKERTKEERGEILDREFSAELSRFKSLWGRPNSFPTSHKLNSILFLSAYFEDASKFDRKIHQWTSWYTSKLPAESAQIPHGGEYPTGFDSYQFELTGGPDPLDLVNLYMLAYSRKSAENGEPMTIDALESEMQAFATQIGETSLPSITARQLICSDEAFPAFGYYGSLGKFFVVRAEKRVLMRQLYIQARRLVIPQSEFSKFLEGLDSKIGELLEYVEKSRVEQKLNSEAIESLLGKWKATKVTDSGQPLNDDKVSHISIEFTKDQVTMVGFDGELSSSETRFRLRAAIDPKQLDIRVNNKWQAGIFQIDKNGILQWVQAGDDNERPTQFEFDPAVDVRNGSYERSTMDDLKSEIKEDTKR